MLPFIKNLTYEDRLRKLKLPSLRFRCLRGDMIEVYKVLSGIHDERVTVGLLELQGNTSTRGHSLKLKKQRHRLDIRKYFFTNRVVEIWNSLPESVVTSKTLNTFKNRLDRFWANQPMLYNYEEDYITNTGREMRMIVNEIELERNTVAQTCYRSEDS